MPRTVAAAVLLLFPAPAAAFVSGLNTRTLTQYLTWRSAVEDLTLPGRVFRIPEAELFDEVPRLPAGLADVCAAANATRQRCFRDDEELAPFPVTAAGGARTAVHRVPTAGHLGGTTHTVVSAEQVPVGQPTVCHRVPAPEGGVTVCHSVTPRGASRLFRVTTRSSATAAPVMLSAICHDDDTMVTGGCHLLAPGDVVFTGASGCHSCTSWPSN